MKGRMMHAYQTRFAACLTAAVSWAGVALSAGLIDNPTFRDGDGDGKPDGWDIKTYVLEDFRGVKCLSMKVPRKDKSSFTGEASAAFHGPEGYYRVTVSYLDEKDGVSKAKLLVNGTVVHIWNFDGTFGDCWRDEAIDNVALKPGDTITLRGRDNPSEYCRIRALRVEPSPNPPSPREIEERAHPPVIADVVYGPLVALRDFRDLADQEDRPEYRPLVLGGGILLLRGEREDVRLGLTLNQPRMPKYSVVFRGAGTNSVLIRDADLPCDPGTGEASIRLPEGPPGLYEISAAQGYWSVDRPHVLGVSARAGDSVRAAGVGAFYFFVPRGTPAFGIGAYCNGGYIAEVAVRAPDGSLVTRMDVPNDAAQGIPIRVRAGQDGRVWSVSVSGVSPRIRLCGVPPCLATHPRHLLVPRECMEAKP